MRRAAWAVSVLILAYLLTLIANRSQLEVRGASMEPTLTAGDRLVTLPAVRCALRAGQIVVVADPHDPEHRVVKRLTDLDRAGATVEVLGDAPHRSTDSQVWGRLPISAVRRIVIARWPDLHTRLHQQR